MTQQTPRPSKQLRRISARRLRVRDDGFGRTQHEAAQWGAFADRDAIILLGDPGSGKTTFFDDESGSNFFTVRSFLVDPPKHDVLFLDALDEFRALSSDNDASSQVAKALVGIGRPRFRLSCRAADWFGSIDNDAFRLASRSGSVVVLELLPLNEVEIIEAAGGIVDDAQRFVREAETIGVGNLLSNPQTLDLVARAWSTGKTPKNKFEAYVLGIEQLMVEPNKAHQARGDRGITQAEMRVASGAVGSVLLLSNSEAVTQTETGEEGLIHFSIVPGSNVQAIQTALKRRIFSFRAPGEFTFIHRTIAEFLAAEDLALRASNGFPVERIMALLCGDDGHPVSSLRGLFAWLICMLGSRSTAYIHRDPYAVVTYGDATVLPPDGQRAAWRSLRVLDDPWFLSSEESRASFRDLANANTAGLLKEILSDANAGNHLKIAALEAMANSATDIGATAHVRRILLDNKQALWVRSAAARAFANIRRTSSNDVLRLDVELQSRPDDSEAPEARLALLQATTHVGPLSARVLSIVKQALATKQKRNVIGRFYGLQSLPIENEWDDLLDGAADVLDSKSDLRYELHSIFEEWLVRRLESTQPVHAARLTSWLRTIVPDNKNDRLAAALQKRFREARLLFDDVIDELVMRSMGDEYTHWAMVAHELWKIVPIRVWPVLPAEVMLERAKRETDTTRASNLFQMYLHLFPRDGTVDLADRGFRLIRERSDIRKRLKKWNQCSLEGWRRQDARREVQSRRKKAVLREQNIRALIPALQEIRAGTRLHMLAWGAVCYFGFDHETGKIKDPAERLESLCNQEAAEALLVGFSNFLAAGDVPSRESILAANRTSSKPWLHSLVALGTYLTLRRGALIPERAMDSAISAALTAFHVGENVPGFDETLTNWIVTLGTEQSPHLREILRSEWRQSMAQANAELIGFNHLWGSVGARAFVGALAQEVLQNSPIENTEGLRTLVGVLLRMDAASLPRLATASFSQRDLPLEAKAIWAAAAYVVRADGEMEFESLWSASTASVWAAFSIFAGGRGGPPPDLSPKQMFTIIRFFGSRFSNDVEPAGGWVGEHSAWDATQFVAREIEKLASDASPEADGYLHKLVQEPSLATWRLVLKHQIVQRARQQRERSFQFPSPRAVAGALDSDDPATPHDFLAYIVDHLNALSYELARTQRERYRAYWNEQGRELLVPKAEEVCSGLLADDLQNRVAPQKVIVTVEHHMVEDKECDLVALKGIDWLLPLEVKHQFHRELWSAWHDQLDLLYASDAAAGGLGVYVVLWSGPSIGRIPRPPKGVRRPTSAQALQEALTLLIPEMDRNRLRVVVVNISRPDVPQRASKKNAKSTTRTAPRITRKRT